MAIPPAPAAVANTVASPQTLAMNATAAGRYIANPGLNVITGESDMQTDWDVATAVAVALAESGGKVAATHRNANGTVDYGAWQINSIHADVIAAHGNEWWNPSNNSQMAHDIWKAAGGSFSPWSTFNSGAYKQHIDVAKQAAGNSNIGAGGPDSVIETNPLAALANGVIGVAQAVFKGAAWMAKPHNWVRVAVVGVGGALVIGGLVVVAGSSLSKAVLGTDAPNPAQLVKKATGGGQDGGKPGTRTG